MEYYDLSEEGVNYGNMGEVYQLIHPKTKEKGGYVSKGVKVSLDSKVDEEGYIISDGEVIVCGNSFIGSDSHVIVESGYLESVYINERSTVISKKAHLIAKNLNVENEASLRLECGGISTRFYSKIFRVYKVILERSNIYVEAAKCSMSNINLDDESTIDLSCRGLVALENIRLFNSEISYIKTTKDFNGETKTCLGDAILSDISVDLSDAEGYRGRPGIEIMGGELSNLIIENVTEDDGVSKLRVDGEDSVTSIIISDYKLKDEDMEVKAKLGESKILIKDE